MDVNSLSEWTVEEGQNDKDKRYLENKVQEVVKRRSRTELRKKKKHKRIY